MLTDNECFRSVCLGVLELTPGHTSDHIADNLSSFLSLWNLETSKICSITTDDRPNTITAVRKLMGNDRSHIPCLAHILNQCVSQALSHSEMATSVIEKVWWSYSVPRYFSDIYLGELWLIDSLILSLVHRWSSSWYTSGEISVCPMHYVRHRVRMVCLRRWSRQAWPHGTARLICWSALARWLAVSARCCSQTILKLLHSCWPKVNNTREIFFSIGYG